MSTAVYDAAWPELRHQDTVRAVSQEHRGPRDHPCLRALYVDLDELRRLHGVTGADSVERIAFGRLLFLEQRVRIDSVVALVSCVLEEPEAPGAIGGRMRVDDNGAKAR